MSNEQYPDRTILERKEREELREIARALSISIPVRMKKADIVDRILEKASNGHVTGDGSAGHAGANGSYRDFSITDVSTVLGQSIAQESAISEPGVAQEAGTTPEHASPEPDAVSEPVAASGSMTTRKANTTSGSVAASGSDDANQSGSIEQLTITPESGTTEEPAASVETATVQESVAASEPVDAEEPSAVQESAVQESAAPGSPVEPTAAPESAVVPGHSEPSESSDKEESAKDSSKSGDEASQKSQNHGQQASSSSRRGRRKRGNKDRPDRANGEIQATQPDTYDGELMATRGILDLRDEGYGFIRSEGYLASSKDVYVSISQVKKFALRKGDWIEGEARPAINNEKYPALIRIDTVGGKAADEIRGRSKFESLTPLFPDQRLTMEVPGDTGSNVLTARIIDLLCPIGKGQRGLIVSPPKAGKTTVMKQIARSIEINNPEVHLMVLLVDERPEEVTDMRRSVKGEVVSSTFDRPSDEHATVAELALERAKRLVELGRDVVIILDGITRLARAYNLAQPATGRIMSGGVDSGALYPPKRFFGAARNIEEGGSLTILATALVETGSKMDEVIFEEFKGTGNMELRLDRHLAERRLYPSIDVNASSTRHEELLFSPGQLQQGWKLRRVLNALAADGSAAAGLELLMDKIRSTKSNDEFLADIAKGPAPPL